MTIRFRCPHRQCRLHTSERAAGSLARCTCHRLVIVPPANRPASGTGSETSSGRKRAGRSYPVAAPFAPGPGHVATATGRGAAGTRAGRGPTPGSLLHGLSILVLTGALVWCLLRLSAGSQGGGAPPLPSNTALSSAPAGATAASDELPPKPEASPTPAPTPPPARPRDAGNAEDTKAGPTRAAVPKGQADPPGPPTPAPTLPEPRPGSEPTLADRQEWVRRQEVRRGLRDPPLTEILSGQTLNDLLADLQILGARGLQGPTVPLEESVLRRINLTGSRIGTLGLLKMNRLLWPPVLSRPEFEPERGRISELLVQARQEALRGRATAETLDEIERLRREMQNKLRAQILTCTPGEHVQAKRFLEEVRAATRALSEPETGRLLSEAGAARGNTVADLVQDLTRRGLRFAAAVEGDESAYVALHRALAGYDRALHVQLGDLENPAPFLAPRSRERRSAGGRPTRQRDSLPAGAPGKDAGWPRLVSPVIGPRLVRVVNPNHRLVKVGVRAGGAGVDFLVPPNGFNTAGLPDGRYDVYFRYADEPDGLYQGDSFTLAGNGIQITLVQVADGNYGIRKVR